MARQWIIFSIASLASKNPFANGAAQRQQSPAGPEAAMLDLRHAGIRMAAILPGSVDTDFGHPTSGAQNSWMLAPEDVARCVVDLLKFPARALPSLIELRPSRPLKK